MVRYGTNNVVAYAGGTRAPHPHWICEERIETTLATLYNTSVSDIVCREEDGSGAYIVEVDIDAPKVLEGKVSDGVCALYRVGIAVPCLDEPRVSGI